MKIFKILFLTTFLSTTNCSFIGDKFLSKKDNNKDNNNENEIVVSDKEEVNRERVYIEDEIDNKNEESTKGDFLKGDEQITEDQEYPNLANVPDRPDPSISIEEQEKIIQDIKDGNVANLEPVPSLKVNESSLNNLDQINEVEKQNDYNLKNDFERTQSIREILNNKLKEIDNFKPNKDTSQNIVKLSEEEKELSALARSLKDIKTTEEAQKVETRIQKNDLVYSPKDIEDILGLKGLDVSSFDDSKTIKQEDKTIKVQVTDKKNNENNKKILNDRSVPVARITFSHGSTSINSKDLNEIKKVVNLFFENKAKKIVIVGHASSRTNYDMDLTKHALINFNISLERATKVMKELSLSGLNNEKIELVALSDSEPLYPEIMPSLEAANRRAEIFIEY